MLNVTMRTIAAGVLLAINISAARAELTIDITEGVEGAIPIAIVPFAWRAAGATAPVDLAAVVSADLEGSGLFRTLPARDMLARPSEASQVSFIDWQALGQENLVIGSVTENGANRYSVRFELFDVFKGAQMAGYRVEATSRNLRQTAHRISDIIYEKLTGRRGASARKSPTSAFPGLRRTSVNTSSK